MDTVNSAPNNDHFLRAEIERLQQQLQQKDREISAQMNGKSNEWAEIYSNQKVNLDNLTMENSNLQTEIQALKTDLEAANQRATAGGPYFGGAKDSSGEEGGMQAAEANAEMAKKLEKREREVWALWDTLKDMKDSGQGTFSTNEMWNLLKKRTLHTKAGRKLDMQV